MIVEILSETGYGVYQFLCIWGMLLIVFRGSAYRKKYLPVDLLTILAFTAGDGLSIYLFKIHMINSMAGFIIFLCLMFIMAFLNGYLTENGDTRQYILVELFYMSHLTGILSITQSTCDVYLEIPTTYGQATAMILLFLLALWYKRITEPRPVKMSREFWISGSITPVLMFIMMTIWAGQPQGNNFLIIAIALLCMNITIYVLLMQLETETQKQTALAIENQTMIMQARQTEAMRQLYENTRKARHELKNNYFLIETLIKDNRADEVIPFLHENVLAGLESSDLIHTGNKTLDLILSNKAMEARSLNIPIIFQVMYQDDSRIDIQVLGGLLLNLLDNAIESSQKVKDPEIRFSMNNVKGYLHIEVRDRIEQSVLVENPKLVTSKQDKGNHGIGMSVIKSVVDKYNGDLKIYEEADDFVVSILL